MLAKTKDLKQSLQKWEIKEELLKLVVRSNYNKENLRIKHKNRIISKELKQHNLRQELNKMLKSMLRVSYSKEMQLNSLDKTLTVRNLLAAKAVFSRKMLLISMV